jgi:hypothetical protein
MSDQPPPSRDSPSSSLLQRVDEICDRFEDAWKAGQRPRIEDYLSDMPEPERSALLRELIALDIAYRRQAEETPELEYYHNRFPEQVELVEAALKRGSKNASRLFYDAARIYAQAVAKAQADPRPLSRHAMAWYQEQAVVLIRQALESLPPKGRRVFWRDTIQLDNALSPIRGSTAFIRLASESSQWAK